MSQQDLDEVLDWLKQHRQRVCPKCQPQSVKPNLIKGTYWCSNCNKTWTVERNKLTRVAHWKYKEIVERIKDIKNAEKEAYTQSKEN